MSSTSQLRFDGRVAIVTGAGNGLGRSHALLLASRGCKVVVNDLGGGATGGGKSSAAADSVVAEIQAAGGEAIANYDSVEDGEKIVKMALDAWKRVDIVINNAGILRDTSFQKMSAEDWDLVQRVHLLGAFRVTQAAWNHMREAGFGRILFTASAAGIYGNFGQANYAAMKLALVGLANTLAVEGAKKNVLSNVIAPIAGSRLTETILPKDIIDALKPELVSPLAAYLCHESCSENGGLFEVGGGYFGKLRWERSEGKTFKLGRAIAPETVRDAWGSIAGFEKATHPSNITESMAPILGNLGTKSLGANEFIDADEAQGFTFEPVTSSYDERDVSLYALGVGAGENPTDPGELKYVFEQHPDFQVLPTFAVVPALKEMFGLYLAGKTAPGLHYGFERVLHAEQYTTVTRPLPTHGKLTHTIKIKDIFDKGKHALVVTEIRTVDEEGDLLMLNEVTTFVRGAGGFGGARGPAGDGQKEPERAPDAIVTEVISPKQALLYRLSGDINPLHVDPAFAQGFGFPKPILHGLCTFGYAARHVLQTFAKNDGRTFKSIRVRFTDTVFPGETLVTEMWKESDTRILFRCKVKERDKVVLGSASIELYTEVPKKAPKAPVAEAKDAGALPKAATAKEPEVDGWTSRDIVSSIRTHIEKNPDMVKQIGTVFQFDLTDPNYSFTIDLKNAGSVTEGAGQGVDCTLTLSQADFLGMATGKLNAQKLYFGKQLKITGNVMASQKLEFLKSIERTKSGSVADAGASAPSAAAAAVSTREPVAPKVVAALTAKSQGWALPKESAVIAFDVREPAAGFSLDLSDGKVSEGVRTDATTTLRMTDEDLAALVKTGDLRSLYQHGNVRIDGDIRVAAAGKLGFLKGLV
ncbi:MAG: SDR family NAD(P)-dependent oxidoreductase [Polyangiaceae bacterium]